MHDIWQTYLTVALVAYLLGSIPSGYILVKLFLKQDIRQTGSGNIGATNVARSGKKGLAIATLLLDAGKGYFGVVLALAVAQRIDAQVALVSSGWEPYLGHNSRLYAPLSIWEQYVTQTNLFWIFPVCLAAVAAIAGHCFPVWLRFRGGKGVATALGAFLYLAPMAVLVSAIFFFASFLLIRIVSASSILAALAFAIAAPLVNPLFLYPATLSALIASCMLIVAKHHANIRRLLNGTEPRFGEKKPAIPPDPIQVEKNA